MKCSEARMKSKLLAVIFLFSTLFSVVWLTNLITFVCEAYEHPLIQYCFGRLQERCGVYLRRRQPLSQAAREHQAC